MIRKERKLTGAVAVRLLLSLALLAGLPLFAACGGDNAEQGENQTVQVRLTDDQIEMPESLPSGMTTFQVTNAGSQEQTFGITGPAGDKALDEPLQPGESAELEMQLDTGTYRVYTPGAQRPVQMALNVRPDAGDSHG